MIFQTSVTSPPSLKAKQLLEVYLTHFRQCLCLASREDRKLFVPMCLRLAYRNQPDLQLGSQSLASSLQSFPYQKCYGDCSEADGGLPLLFRPPFFPPQEWFSSSTKVFGFPNTRPHEAAFQVGTLQSRGRFLTLRSLRGRNGAHCSRKTDHAPFSDSFQPLSP